MIPIQIQKTALNFERESLVRAFGFKGHYTAEIWQTIVQLTASTGAQAIGLGTQGILWSDARIFAAHTETGGNALMYLITEHALQLAQHCTFSTPFDLFDYLYEPLLAFSRTLTGLPELRPTFVLNALTPLDFAAWLLYAQTNAHHTFEAMLPPDFQPLLTCRHPKLASIPLITYNLPLSEVQKLIDAGHGILKIKLGHPGTQSQMLEQDQARLAQIHQLAAHAVTTMTPDGRIRYYLDANGRYENKATVQKLLDFIQKIGGRDQLLLIEEPFPEHLELEVTDLGVWVAADESLQTVADVIRRIEMGYRVLALKPIAKTLSLTLKMLQAANRAGIPCFCADLTVNPIQVEWNKNVAARLAPLPGFQYPMFETNGAQNYRRWAQLLAYHPCAGAEWLPLRQGFFELTEKFYQQSGGIFLPAPHYQQLVAPGMAG